MFPFDADHTDCRYLDPTKKCNGKVWCSKHKEYVAANGKIRDKSADYCNDAAEVMGRSTSEKQALARYSKSHGYYVVTAITEVLGLPEDNKYMESFIYLRDVILPANEEYHGFIDDYEIDGPELADLIRKDEKAEEYAEYLRVAYLNRLISLLSQGRIDEAITLYTSMLDAIKEKYGYSREYVKMREIHIHNGCAVL